MAKFSSEDVNAVIGLSWQLSHQDLDRHLSILCSALAIAARQGGIPLDAFIANAGETYLQMSAVEIGPLDPNRRMDS